MDHGRASWCIPVGRTSILLGQYMSGAEHDYATSQKGGADY